MENQTVVVLAIGTCAVGTAQAALDRAVQYVSERSQFGKTLNQFNRVQFKLADMLTELVAARQMVRLAAYHLDNGSPDATTYCAMAKRLATDISFEVANQALYNYMVVMVICTMKFSGSCDFRNKTKIW